MANGTIAFDTLTTSDSVNTGTEKSIDTSYIFNGVFKVRCRSNQRNAQYAIIESFNTSSITDESGVGQSTMGFTNNFANANFSSTTNNDTGDYTMNFTNAMNDTVYAPQFLQGDQSGAIDLGLK